MIRVGRDTFMKSLDCLAPRGLMVSFGNASGPPDPIPRRAARAEGLAVPDPADPVRLHRRRASELEQRAGELFDIVASGKVKIEVKQRFALKDAAEAHRALEARKTSGSTDPHHLDAAAFTFRGMRR